MNLKIALLVSLLFCVNMTVTAQEVVYSEFDKFDFRTDEYSVVGMCGNRLYTYRKTEDGALLESYNDSMDKVAQVLLDFFPDKIYEARFIPYPDKIIVLYQGLESNKVVQYAALLDDKGRLQGKPVELGSVKTGIFGATKSYFLTAISENKKNILIYSINEKSESIEFDGKWLDDKAMVLKRSKVVFKTENRAEHGEVSIGNDGSVHMAAYSTAGAQNYADQYWILALAPGATKFEPKELALGDKFAASGYIKLDNANGRIYFGGFYAGKKNSNYDGLIYASYDIASGAFQSVKFIPFDQELISAAGARRRSHAFDNYEVKHLIVKNDGGFVMIAEVHFVTTRNTFNPGFGYYSYYSPAMSSITHEYHYNDIMALSYNKDGERQWSAFVPKEQYSQEDGGVFSSFALLNSGGSLAFLFNDFNSRDSRIQLATLDAAGKTETHSFAPEGKDKPDWIPKSGKQVAARVLIVPCFHKKQICFAKVVF